MLATLMTLSLISSPEVRASPRPTLYRAMARRVAREEGIEPRLLLAVVEIESGFDHRKRGADGEIGMAQVMPFWSRVFKIPTRYLFDPENNLRASARILRRCRGRWRADFRRLGRVHPGLRRRLVAPFGPATFTAVCYNWGRVAHALRARSPRDWSKVGIPRSTQGYARRFQRAYLALRG